MMETKANYEKIVKDIHAGKYKAGKVHHVADGALEALDRDAESRSRKKKGSTTSDPTLGVK
jgi:hypothetical protein